MKIKTLTAIKHNGANVPIDSTLTVDESDKSAVKEFDRLVRLGAAEVVESADPKDSDELGGGETHLDQTVDKLCELEGVEADLAHKLIDAGFTTVKEVYEADPKDLEKIKGVGKKTAEKMQLSAEPIIEKDDPDYFEE